jgi:NitT/TauT family transport system substrate-binding protein
MSQNKSLALTFLTLLVLVSGSACAPKTTPPAALTPLTVQLAWDHTSQFAGLYAADLKGFYADEGLAVTFLPGGANKDKLAPLLDGTAQFGVAGADELILARSEGKPLKAVATIYRRSPVVFISLAEKGITRPQDFAGKTIRAPAILKPTLHSMMTRIGIPPDQYEVVDLPSDLTLFTSGDVPVWGVYVTALVVTITQAGYKLNLVFPDDYGVHFYSDSIIATDDLISNNPDLVLRFVRASLKGWTFAVENPTEIGAMVKIYNPAMDSALENAKMIASLPLINTGEDHIGWMKPDVWDSMEQTLREQDVISLPLDVTQAYNLQFLEKIYSAE